jgi:hypothetical protein
MLLWLRGWVRDISEKLDDLPLTNKVAGSSDSHVSVALGA